MVRIVGDGKLGSGEGHSGNLPRSQIVGDSFAVEPCGLGRYVFGRWRRACTKDFEGRCGSAAHGDIGRIEHAEAGIERSFFNATQIGRWVYPGNAGFVEELIAAPVLHRHDCESCRLFAARAGMFHTHVLR